MKPSDKFKIRHHPDLESEADREKLTDAHWTAARAAAAEAGREEVRAWDFPNWTGHCEYYEQKVILRRRDRGAIEFEWKAPGTTGKGARRRIGTDADALARTVFLEAGIDRDDPVQAVAWAEIYLRRRHSQFVEQRGGEDREDRVEAGSSMTLTDGHFLWKRDYLGTYRDEKQRRGFLRVMAAIEAPEMEIDPDRPIALLTKANYVNAYIRCRTTKDLTLPDWYPGRTRTLHASRCSTETAAADLRLYQTILNDLAEMRGTKPPHPKLLPDGHPVRWEWIPKKRHNPRPRYDPAHVDILRGLTPHPETGRTRNYLREVDPTGQLELGVVGLRRSGHRIGSVLELRRRDRITEEKPIERALRRCEEKALIEEYARDFARAGGVLWWRAEFDKEGLDRVLPVHGEFECLIDRRCAEIDRAGTGPLTPLLADPSHPMRPIRYHLLLERMRAAEDRARADGWEIPESRSADPDGDPDDPDNWPEDYGPHGLRANWASEMDALGHSDWVADLVGGWTLGEAGDMRKRKYVRGDAEQIVACAKGRPAIRGEVQRMMEELLARTEAAEERADRAERQLAELLTSKAA